jgi:hypothetical protein
LGILSLLKYLSLACLAAGLLLGCAPATKNAGSPDQAAARADAPPPKNLILSEYTAGGLKDYLADVGSIGHGYFAVAVDGGDYAWWLCDQIACTRTRSWERARALEDCRKESGGVDCIILAENRNILLDYQTYPIPLPPLAAADIPPQAASTAPQPPAPPADQRAKKDRPGWTVDQLHGCWIWNLAPDGEADIVTWTGACATDGTATGMGVLEWKDVERYIGPMQAGRKEGQGKKVNAWGETYAGGFKYGEHDGHGTYVWSDGSRYDGNYTDGYANGLGTFTERGEVYSGEWKNGCFDDGKKKYRILRRNVPGCS